MNQTLARNLAMLVFGIFLPILITIGAERKIHNAQNIVAAAVKTSHIINVFFAKNELLDSADDYRIVALADSERANLAIMVNKQSMKIVVIYMGFAVISFALMFIVLGFTDLPVSASGEASGFKLDLKFGSVGAMVFVLGAAMSAAGGLLKNEYQTVQIPEFHTSNVQIKAIDSDKSAMKAQVCPEIDDPKDRELCLKGKQEINDGGV